MFLRTGLFVSTGLQGLVGKATLQHSDASEGYGGHVSRCSLPLWTSLPAAEWLDIRAHLPRRGRLSPHLVLAVLAVAVHSFLLSSGYSVSLGA